QLPMSNLILTLPESTKEKDLEKIFKEYVKQSTFLINLYTFCSSLNFGFKLAFYSYSASIAVPS
ncbi:MAG: hypothetical protein ACRC06_19285, partial [Waterburya sp.]